MQYCPSSESIFSVPYLKQMVYKFTKPVQDSKDVRSNFYIEIILNHFVFERVHVCFVITWLSSHAAFISKKIRKISIANHFMYCCFWNSGCMIYDHVPCKCQCHWFFACCDFSRCTLAAENLIRTKCPWPAVILSGAGGWWIVIRIDGLLWVQNILKEHIVVCNGNIYRSHIRLSFNSL